LIRVADAPLITGTHANYLKGSGASRAINFALRICSDVEEDRNRGADDLVVCQRRGSVTR
jgi:hypothetical protein